MPPKPRHFVEQSDIDAVLDTYALGYTITQVKAILCLEASEMTIERLLKKHGAVRHRGHQLVHGVCESCGNPFAGKAYNTRACRGCVPNRAWEQRWSLYQVAKPQFKTMWHKQSGLCALCELPLPKVLKDIKIDHCHKTGKVRGLLHHKCNVGLHYIEDDKFLARAVRYIERHKA